MIAALIKRWQLKRRIQRIRDREGFLVFCQCDKNHENPLNIFEAVEAVCGMWTWECIVCWGLSEFDMLHYPLPVLVRFIPAGGAK